MKAEKGFRYYLCPRPKGGGMEIFMNDKRVTFADIAKYTNFSKTTISRYFNNPDSLTLKNQEIIAKALIDLDYKENKVAKIFASGKTEFVGIIVPNLYLHYYSEMLNQILDSYEKFGYKFLIFAGNSNETVERQYIQELLAYHIEGMIMLSHTIPSKELASYNIPIVTIEREDEYTCSINSDNYMGGAQAAGLLHKSNCDVLIHINVEVPKNVPAYGRIQGFLDTCKEHSLSYELILKDMGNSFEENQRKLMEIVDYLDRKYPDKCKGVFLANDSYAGIFLNILVRAHGGLPEDYRIIGFDNSPVSKEAVIPISTVGQQIDKIARTAMELLVEQMEERKKRQPKLLEKPIHRVITPVLVHRETTGILKG